MNIATNTRHCPVIRVFVSSTFSDLKHERNELQRTVFRELEEHCLRRRFQFQAIDLRWGVPSEASLDHRTMRICFEELRRSQQISPQPNFLILLGDRYGWRPLPEEISLAEYQTLADAVATDPAALQVLKDWYRRDENAVPPVHVLRSRRDSPDSRNYGRDEATRQDSAAWKEVQVALWAIINRAFPSEQLDRRFDPDHLAASSIPSIVRFQASATEQEIWHGALQAPDATQHVFAFVRKLSNVEQCLADARPEQKLGDFVDLQPDGSRDADARKAQTQLLEALEKRLGVNGYQTVTADAQLQLDKAKDRFDVSTKHIQALCTAVREKLLPVIDQQMKEYWKPTGTVQPAAAVGDAGSAGLLSPLKLRELELEIAAHARFGDERAPEGVFVGREQETARILNYLRGDDSRPLVVHGPSGTGKTALLANAVRVAESELGRKPIVRYLGTTPHSGSVRSLLTSLCRQLRRDFGVAGDPPSEFRELEDDFAKLLADNSSQPIYLFLDALDQLDDTNNGRRLAWLRYSAQQPLPNHVKLVVSCLSDVPEAEPCGQPFQVLEQHQLTTSGIAINELTRDEASALLFDRWLRKETGSDVIHLSEGRLAHSNVKKSIFDFISQTVRYRWHRFALLLANLRPRGIAKRQSIALHGRPHRTVTAELQRAYLQKCIDQVTDGTECRRPLYLKILYEEARLWRSFDQPPVTVPETVADLLRGLFRRLRQPEQHGPLVNRAIGYLAASRFGLAENELLEILFADLDYRAILDQANQRLGHEFPPRANRIPIALWARLQHDLQPYLADRAAVGGQVLSFYHRQVTEWVRGRFARFNAPHRGRHQRLADYFVGCAAGPNPAQRFESESVRGFSEAVFHCIHSEQADRAGELLQSFSYLLNKLRVGLLDTVTSDYALAVAHASLTLRLKLEVWQSFFLTRGHILRRGCDEWPAQKILLQLAIEHSDNSPITIAAEVWLDGGHCNWFWLRRATRLPHVENSPCLAVLEGHTDSINGALLLSDARILSWSNDLTLRLWDGSCGAPVAILAGHTGFVNGVIVLPDGRLLSWSYDAQMRLWDGSSGTPLAVLAGHTESVDGACALPDGHVLSWSLDKTLRLWDGTSGVCLAVLEGHAAPVSRALVLSDGRILSWSDDLTLRLWDGASGAPLAILAGHTESVNGACALPDGRILSWSGDGTLRFWDGASGAPLAVLAGHTESVNGACALPDGRILSWSKDKTLRLWDGAHDQPLAVLEGHASFVLGASALSDGRILSWSKDKTLRLWDGTHDQPLAVLEGHASFVLGASALPDGRILSWSWDKTLRLWDGTSGLCSVVLSGHAEWIDGAFVLSDNRILSWSGDQTLRIWEFTIGASTPVLMGHTKLVMGASALPDGRILSWSGDGTLRLWNGANGSCLIVFTGHTKWVEGASALPDGRILSWSGDGTLRLWDGASGTPLAVLAGHTESVDGACALPDGHVLSWSLDKTLRLWDGTSGVCLAVLEGHAAPVSRALVLSDGRILSWSDDSTLRLWDGMQAVCLMVLKGHTWTIGGATALDGGRMILSWSWDKSFRLWDGVSGDCMKVMFEDQVARQHPEWLHARAEMTANETISGRFFAESQRYNCDLHHDITEDCLASWHAEHECKTHCIQPDGTIVASQPIGEVCILKLYHGSRRVSLADAESLLTDSLPHEQSLQRTNP